MNHRSWRVRARGPARRARPRRARAFHAFVQSCAFGERTTRTAREARRARGRRRRRETRSYAVVSLARRERNDAAIARETRTTGATPRRLSPESQTKRRTTDERRIFVQARRPCTRRSRRISRGSSANGRFTRTRRDQKDLGLRGEQTALGRVARRRCRRFESPSGQTRRTKRTKIYLANISSTVG